MHISKHILKDQRVQRKHCLTTFYEKKVRTAEQNPLPKIQQHCFQTVRLHGWGKDEHIWLNWGIKSQYNTLFRTAVQPSRSKVTVSLWIMIFTHNALIKNQTLKLNCIPDWTTSCCGEKYLILQTATNSHLLFILHLFLLNLSVWISPWCLNMLPKRRPYKSRGGQTTKTPHSQPERKLLCCS